VQITPNFLSLISLSLHLKELEVPKFLRIFRLISLSLHLKLKDLEVQEFLRIFSLISLKLKDLEVPIFVLTFLAQMIQLAGVLIMGVSAKEAKEDPEFPLIFLVQMVQLVGALIMGVKVKKIKEASAQEDPIQIRRIIPLLAQFRLNRILNHQILAMTGTPASTHRKNPHKFLLISKSMLKGVLR
jgi:hypothetical protein